MPHFCIFFGVLSLLFLVHFSESSSHEQRNAIEIEHHERISDEKVFDIVVHGIVLWASMGLLIPVGILAIRMSSCTNDFHPSRHKILLYVHAVFQVLSVLLVTIGAVLSIRKFENAFNNTHQRIGVALYGATYIQLFIGLIKRPNRECRGRRMWYVIHWILGTSISLVGILNIYIGIQAYHKRSRRNTTLWTIVFTAQLCFMIIFYLFQEKWGYITRQGINTPNSCNDINIPNNSLPVEIEIIGEVENDEKNACRKSNALGTYFLTTNALNKLFQVT